MALERYTKVLHFDANNPEALAEIGRCHAQLGRYDEAIAYLMRARDFGPDRIETRLGLAPLLLRRNEVDEARAEAMAVVERAPDNLDALALLAESARTEREADETLSHLGCVSDAVQRTPRYGLILGRAYVQRGDLNAAQAAYEWVMGVDGDSTVAQLRMAEVQMRRLEPAEAEHTLRNAALTGPDTVAPIRLADFYILSGRRAEAHEVLERLLLRYPGHRPARRLLAALDVDAGRLDEAERASALLLERNPKDTLALIIASKVDRLRGETDAALGHLEQLQAVARGSALPDFLMAKVLLDKGQLEEARDKLRGVVAHTPGYIDAGLLLASVELRLGEHEAAIATLVDLAERQPELARVQQLLGTAYLAQGDTDRALSTYTRLTELRPTWAMPAYLVGLVHLQRGDEALARSWFETAIERDPGFAPPLDQLVGRLVDAHQTEAALRLVQQQIARAPRSGDLQALLAKVYAARGDVDGAEAAWCEQIELQPKRIRPRLELGRLCAAYDRHLDAINHLQVVIEQEPQKWPEVYELMGALYQRMGQLWPAEEHYRKALKLDPKRHTAANNLAYLIAVNGGNQSEALSLARRAHDLVPNNPAYNDTLGWLLVRQGNAREAVDLLAQAVRWLPRNPEVRCHLGIAQLRLGDRDTARSELDQALALSTAFRGADECRQARAEIR